MHTMHRSIVSRLFTPRAVAGLEAQIRELCVEIVDGLVGRDSFDFMRDFALRLPVQVIGMLVGVPKEDQADLLAVFQKSMHEGSADPESRPRRGHPRRRRVVQRVPRLARAAPVRRRDDPAHASSSSRTRPARPARCAATRSSPTSRSSPRRAATPPPPPSAGPGSLLSEHPDQRRRAGRRPVADPPGRRRGAAVRAALVPLLPLVHQGHRVPRPDDPGREHRRDDPAGREPRRAPVGGLRALRHPPQAGPALHASASVRTSAWAPTWPGWRPASRSRRSSPASPSGPATSRTPELTGGIDTRGWAKLPVTIP